MLLDDGGRPIPTANALNRGIKPRLAMEWARATRWLDVNRRKLAQLYKASSIKASRTCSTVQIIKHQGIKDSPACSWCGEERQTTLHMLRECPKDAGFTRSPWDVNLSLHDRVKAIRELQYLYICNFSGDVPNQDKLEATLAPRARLALERSSPRVSLVQCLQTINTYMHN